MAERTGEGWRGMVRRGGGLAGEEEGGEIKVNRYRRRRRGRSE